MANKPENPYEPNDFYRRSFERHWQKHDKAPPSEGLVVATKALDDAKFTGGQQRDAELNG